MVRALIGRPVPVSARNNHGATPLDLASTSGSWRIERLLQDAGAARTGPRRENPGMGAHCWDNWPNYRLLGYHVGMHHLAATARATAYRTAKQSEVFCALCDMLDLATNSDDAIMHPRQAEWREPSPLSFLREVVREVEVVPGVIGLPSSDLQKRVVEILSGLGGMNYVMFWLRGLRILGLNFVMSWPRALF